MCRNCPLNQPAQGCACALLYKMIAEVVPAGRKLEGLHICRVCKCTLQVKVNLLAEHIAASNAGRNFNWPAGECWQRDIDNPKA